MAEVSFVLTAVYIYIQLYIYMYIDIPLELQGLRPMRFQEFSEGALRFLWIETFVLQISMCTKEPTQCSRLDYRDQFKGQLTLSHPKHCAQFTLHEAGTKRNNGIL